MTNTFTDFFTAYQKASPSIQAIIDSEEIGLFIDTLALVDLKTNPSLKPKLLVIISNLILSVSDGATLQNSLTKLNLNDPLLLEEIKLFVSTKLGTPIKVTKPAAITSTHETNNNQNLRTMESDSKQIGYGDPAEELTYTTMQSALLQESARKDPLK